MSASTNIVQNDNDFDSNAHIRELCANTNICVPNYLDAQYYIGWKSLMEDFIAATRNCHILLEEIGCVYGSLEIRFALTKRTHEVKVWRAIERARLMARQTCAFCGYQCFSGLSLIDNKLLCSVCMKQGGVNGNTGTWLDKF